jgi:hypothetical protein
MPGPAATVQGESTQIAQVDRLTFGGLKCLSHHDIQCAMPK